MGAIQNLCAAPLALLALASLLVIPAPAAAASPWNPAPPGTPLAVELDAVLQPLARGESPEGRRTIWVKALKSRRQEDATWVTRVAYQRIEWRSAKKAAVLAWSPPKEEGAWPDAGRIPGRWRFADSGVEGELASLLPAGQVARLVVSWDEEGRAYPEVNTDGNRIRDLDPVLVRAQGALSDVPTLLYRLRGQSEPAYAVERWEGVQASLAELHMPIPVDLLGVIARTRTAAAGGAVSGTTARVAALRRLRAQVLAPASVPADRMALANALARITACGEALGWAESAQAAATEALPRSKQLRSCEESSSARPSPAVALTPASPEARALRRALHRAIELDELPTDLVEKPSDAPSGLRYTCSPDVIEVGETVLEFRLADSGKQLGLLVVQSVSGDAPAFAIADEHFFIVPEHPEGFSPLHIVRLRFRSWGEAAYRVEQTGYTPGYFVPGLGGGPGYYMPGGPTYTTIFEGYCVARFEY